MREGGPSLPELLFARLFLLANSRSVPAEHAGRVPALCAARSRKASVTSGWIRKGMRSSCPDYENVSLESGMQHELK